MTYKGGSLQRGGHVQSHRDGGPVRLAQPALNLQEPLSDAQCRQQQTDHLATPHTVNVNILICLSTYVRIANASVGDADIVVIVVVVGRGLVLPS